MASGTQPARSAYLDLPAMPVDDDAVREGPSVVAAMLQLGASVLAAVVVLLELAALSFNRGLAPDLPSGGYVEAAMLADAAGIVVAVGLVALGWYLRLRSEVSRGWLALAVTALAAPAAVLVTLLLTPQLDAF